MASRYYPKAQRHYGFFTKGNEYMFPTDFKEYKGPYHWYGAGGKQEIVYTGASKTPQSQVLVPYKDVAKDPYTFLYDKITDVSLGEWIAPVGKKPKPKKEDRTRGYIMRYFIKKSNDQTAPIIEIDQKQYKKCRPKAGRHINGYMYSKVSLRWKLNGPQKDVKKGDTLKIAVKGVEDTNRRTVFAKNMEMEGLSNLLRDLTKYSIYDQIQTQKGAGIMVPDLIETDGSEFVLSHGTPYVGFYHIHPTKGTFIGKKHTNKFDQAKLISFAEYAISKAAPISSTNYNYS